MLNASASSIRTGDKVVLTERIPPRVLNDRSSVQPLQGGEVLQLLHGAGTVWGVKDTRIGYVHLAYELKNAVVISFKEDVFEKYFAVRV